MNGHSLTNALGYTGRWMAWILNSYFPTTDHYDRRLIRAIIPGAPLHCSCAHPLRDGQGKIV